MVNRVSSSMIVKSIVIAVCLFMVPLIGGIGTSMHPNDGQMETDNENEGTVFNNDVTSFDPDEVRPLDLREKKELLSGMKNEKLNNFNLNSFYSRWQDSRTFSARGTESEPNNGLTNATPITVGDPTTGDLSGSDRADFFKVDVSASDKIVANLTVPAGGNYSLDIIEPQFNEELDYMAEASLGGYRQVSGQATIAGEHYVGVFCQKDDTGQYSTGQYTLLVTTEAGSPDSDNTPATGTSMSNGVPVKNQVINPNYDHYDWYTITPPITAADSNLSIEVEHDLSTLIILTVGQGQYLMPYYYTGIVNPDNASQLFALGSSPPAIFTNVDEINTYYTENTTSEYNVFILAMPVLFVENQGLYYWSYGLDWVAEAGYTVDFGYNMTLSAVDPNNEPPQVTNAQADPSSVEADGVTPVLLSAQCTDDSAVTQVVVDISDIGGSPTATMYDDGTNGDQTASDNVYSLETTVAEGTPEGATTLKVTATDDQSSIGSADIVLTVLKFNHAPEVDTTPTVNMNEDSTYNQLDLSDVFSDPDGDSLSFSSEPADPDNDHINVNIGGSDVTLIPDTNWNGEQDIVFNATDPGGKSVEATITVKVAAANDNPKIDHIFIINTQKQTVPNGITVTANEDEWFNFTMIASDVDMDFEGDSLSWDINLDQAFPGLQNSNTQVDPLTSTKFNVSLYPTQDEVGDHSVTIKATDSNSGSDSVTFKIKVQNVNDPPRVVSIEDEESNVYNIVDPDTPIEFNVKENEYLNLTVLAEDDDPEDEDYLKYSTDSVYIEFTGTSDNTIQFHPTASQIDDSPYTVQLIVKDLNYESGHATIKVTVENKNERPEAAITAPEDGESFDEGEEITFDASDSTPGGNDADYGDELTYVWTIDDGKQLGTGEEVKKAIDDPGEHTITLTVTDGGEDGMNKLSASTSITIDIDEVSDGGDGDDGEDGSDGTDGGDGGDGGSVGQLGLKLGPFEDEDDDPVVGAKITVKDGGGKTVALGTTDSEGYGIVAFTSPPTNGTYKVTVEKDGYDTETYDINVAYTPTGGVTKTGGDSTPTISEKGSGTEGGDDMLWIMLAVIVVIIVVVLIVVVLYMQSKKKKAAVAAGEYGEYPQEEGYDEYGEGYGPEQPYPEQGGYGEEAGPYNQEEADYYGGGEMGAAEYGGQEDYYQEGGMPPEQGPEPMPGDEYGQQPAAPAGDEMYGLPGEAEQQPQQQAQMDQQAPQQPQMEAKSPQPQVMETQQAPPQQEYQQQYQQPQQQQYQQPQQQQYQQPQQQQYQQPQQQQYQQPQQQQLTPEQQQAVMAKQQAIQQRIAQQQMAMRQQQTAQQQGQYGGGMRRCPYCGAMAQPGWNVCPNCRRPLQ